MNKNGKLKTWIIVGIIIIGIFLVLGAINSADKNEQTNDNNIIPEDDEQKEPEQLSFSQPGSLGMFDPSIESDSTGNLYMSYSSGEVAPSEFRNSAPAFISTRLALSSDNGKSWEDQNIVIFQPEDADFPNNPKLDNGIWQYEVSNIIYDKGAPSNEKWKIFSHRYIESSSGRSNEATWISLKTSPSPYSWSPERKLFTGFIYDTLTDETIGQPEIKLDKLDSSLSDCAAFTEPGAVGKDDVLYLSLYCATGAGKDRVILLKLSHPEEDWSYVGVVLNRQDANSIGADAFSGQELLSVRGKDYIVVSSDRGGTYKGCMVFEFEDINSAKLIRSNGKPVLIKEIKDTGAELNGACTYDESASESGIIYFERGNPANQPFLKLYKSFVNI